MATRQYWIESIEYKLKAIGKAKSLPEAINLFHEISNIATHAEIDGETWLTPEQKEQKCTLKK